MAEKGKPKQTPARETCGLAGLPVYGLLAVFLFGMMYGRNLSGDVWWHLKTGQWIVRNLAFPYNDPFSYTARSPIIFQEWGAQVIEWLVYSRISPNALAAMAVLLISSAFALSFRLAVKRSRSAFPSFLTIAVGASAAAGWSEMRPQVFSFLFFALALLILQRYHERGGRIVWLLAPLIMVWANFHGVFMAALAIIILEAALAVVVPPEWAWKRRSPRLAAAGPLAAVGAVSALLALVNPNGVALYLYPFRLMGHPDTTRLLNEWRPPSFDEWTGRSLLALLLLSAVGFVCVKGRPKLRDLAYVLVLGTGALLSRRHAVLFALACAPIAAVWLSAGVRAVKRRVSDRAESYAGMCSWGLLAALVATLFVWRLYDARGFRPFDYMNHSEVFPARACDFLLSHNYPGPMFNDFNYGGYLMWRLWPRYRVFVDGRGEPFFQGSFEDSGAACVEPGAWRRVFAKYGVKLAVVYPETPLASELLAQSDWDLVYSDDKACVFVRDGLRPGSGARGRGPGVREFCFEEPAPVRGPHSVPCASIRPRHALLNSRPSVAYSDKRVFPQNLITLEP